MTKEDNLAANRYQRMRLVTNAPRFYFPTDQWDTVIDNPPTSPPQVIPKTSRGTLMEPPLIPELDLPEQPDNVMIQGALYDIGLDGDEIANAITMVVTH